MEMGMIFVLVILFAFVLPIVVFGIWTTHKKDMIKLSANLHSSEKANLQNELAAVKSRLEVLEAIVTDKKYQLSQEISALQGQEKNTFN